MSRIDVQNYRASKLWLAAIVCVVFAAAVAFTIARRFGPQIQGVPPLRSSQPTDTQPSKYNGQTDDVDSTESPVAAKQADQSDAEVGLKLSSIRRYLFEEEPNTWSYYEELLLLYRGGNQKDEIFALLQELAAAFPGSTSPREALGRILAEDEKWDLAKPYFESVLEYSDRPFTVRLSLAMAEFETNEPEAAIEQARALKKMLREYDSKKRDAALLKEEIQGGHFLTVCLVESLALMRLEKFSEAENVSRTCLDGTSKAEDFRARLNAITARLEDLQNRSLKEIVEILD